MTNGVDVTVEYTADVVGPMAGVDHRRGYVLDNLDIGATFDMGTLAGWRDTTMFVHLLNNSGAAPNDDIGTLQGVDNIEVTRQRARLYEAWIDKDFGGLDLRAGLYDLNSEFYNNDAAGLLLAPAFGIGSELAATGPNGPSIFPSTALAVRAAVKPSEHETLQFAALNAHAGVLGDPDGVDTSFDDGALLIGEWSWSGDTVIKIGAWTYTERQNDIRDTGAGGDPLKRRAFGAYLASQRTLWGDDERNVQGSLRIGFA
ncbi:MAG: carbohydrate porin, partial [Pseudomonadota bacterium]